MKVLDNSTWFEVNLCLFEDLNRKFPGLFKEGQIYQLLGCDDHCYPRISLVATGACGKDRCRGRLLFEGMEDPSCFGFGGEQAMIEIKEVEE